MSYQSLIKEGFEAYNKATTPEEKRKAMEIMAKAKKAYWDELVPLLTTKVLTKKN